MWANEEQGNNVDYGETFVSTLFDFFNDNAWYFDYGVLVHLLIEGNGLTILKRFH
jgi:hypothetical protein